MKIDEKEASLYGKSVTNDVAPIIKDGRTMLPVRFVAESLGATVEWNSDARYIRIAGADGNIIDMRVDEEGSFANGYYQKLDVAPFVQNNRTYTPVRFIAESLGAEVYWNQATQEVAEFMALYEEYMKNPDTVKKQLYLFLGGYVFISL